MSLQPFLETYTNPESRKAYRIALRGFLELIYPGETDYESMATRYLAGCKNGAAPHQDLMRYAASLSSKAPKTIQNRTNAVITWLEFNEFELKRSQRKAIGRKMPPNFAITQDKQITAEDIKLLCAHAPLLVKALILFLASSGMRVGEALALLPSDVSLDEDPCRINVRYGVAAKKGPQRWTFISREAKDVLVTWIAYRAEYITRKEKEVVRGKYDPEDPRLFPTSYENVHKIWNRMLKRVKMERRDPRTNLREVHIHGLRKFFRTRLGAFDEVEKMMGHEGYLTGPYVRLTPEDLAAFYKANESKLWIDTPIIVEDTEAQKRNEQQGKNMDELEQRYDALFREMQRIKEEKIAQLRREIGR